MEYWRDLEQTEICLLHYKALYFQHLIELFSNVKNVLHETIHIMDCKLISIAHIITDSFNGTTE